MFQSSTSMAWEDWRALSQLKMVESRQNLRKLWGSKNCLHSSNLLQRHKNFYKNSLCKPLLPGYKALNSHSWKQRCLGNQGVYSWYIPTLKSPLQQCSLHLWYYLLDYQLFIPGCKPYEKIVVFILLSILPVACPR